MSESLRQCRFCGLEAYTEKDLGLFVKHKLAPHGRTTLCKKCSNRNQRNREKAKRGDIKHILKNKLKAIRRRCYGRTSSNFNHYGGRGIHVCDEWLNDPDTFVKWALENGFNPNLEIGRVDNDGQYAPWNCNFITRSQNMYNTRRTVTNVLARTRICRKCKDIKSLSEYHLDKSRPMGHMYICKECRKRLK